MKAEIVTKIYWCGNSCYSLPQPMTIKKAKEWARRWFEVKRLPKNTCFI